MSKRHYCNKCGLSMTVCNGRSNLRWMIANDITECNECDPKKWKKAEQYHMPLKALLKNRKVYNQWSKYLQ